MTDQLKPESMWDGHINRMNTGTIQNKLRDPIRMKYWWDQYGMDAADYIDRLEKERDAYKHRMIHLDAMNSSLLQTLGNIFKAVRPEGIQAPDGRVFEYDPVDPEMARLYWKVMQEYGSESEAAFQAAKARFNQQRIDCLLNALSDIEADNCGACDAVMAAKMALELDEKLQTIYGKSPQEAMQK